MDDLDIRRPEVLMWLPCIWFGRMLEAQAAFIDQLAHDTVRAPNAPARTSLGLGGRPAN
jgi:hypothetical protein